LNKVHLLFISLRVNTSKTNPFTLRGKSIEEVDSFIYLGSMVAKDGGVVQDVSQQIRKANGHSYNSTQCGKTAEYLLGPNSASSAVMLSRCCYIDLRHGK
jgi:hypothetical protein